MWGCLCIHTEFGKALPSYNYISMHAHRKFLSTLPYTDVCKRNVTSTVRKAASCLNFGGDVDTACTAAGTATGTACTGTTATAGGTCVFRAALTDAAVSWPNWAPAADGLSASCHRVDSASAAATYVLYEVGNI